MNKVIAINLGGMAYQLEEGGYDALRAYLESATGRLQGNPDRDEILSDIENAIGEKFRALLAGHKNVVTEKEVAAVLAEMGPIEAEPGPTPTGEAGRPGASNQPGGRGTPEDGPSASSGGCPRRLYRIHEGAMIAGVCNGIGAYFGIDPTVVRLGFVLLTILWGAGLLVYIIMAIVVPEARSPEEKAAASGIPSTAQEFIRRAREGYYEAMKNFPDRAARRAWKRRFKRDLRAQADQWRFNWRLYWSQPAPVHPGMGFALPLLSLMQGALAVAWICAIISLLATGTVLGMALPANVPVWVAALLLPIAYGFLVAPLKAARRLCYWSLGRPKWAWPFVFLADALVWLIVAAALLLLGIRFFPELRVAIQGLPLFLHQAAADIRNWWHGK
jgi:phage shock protein PspC (stress-responsive transcriptional regulator)